MTNYFDVMAIAVAYLVIWALCCLIFAVSHKGKNWRTKIVAFCLLSLWPFMIPVVVWLGANVLNDDNK